MVYIHTYSLISQLCACTNGICCNLSFSAYTEAYNVCSLAAAPQAVSVGDVGGETTAEEDQGRTSEEEEGGADSSYQRQVIHLLSL